MARFAASICLIAVHFAQGVARRVGDVVFVGEVGSHNERPQATSEASVDVPDVIACDQLCMQCPDGRNVLIQRKRSRWKKMGVAAAVGAGGIGGALAGAGIGGIAGAAGAGLLASQLASCELVGFEIWRNRELQDEQPWVNEYMGLVAGWKAGLQKLNRSSNTVSDRVAYDACEKIVQPAIWVAVRDRMTGDADHSDETSSVRTCLSHSKLCNPAPGEEWTTVLNTNRFSLNPVTGVEMCSEPMRQNNGTIHNRQGSRDTVSKQINEKLAHAEFLSNELMVHAAATLADSAKDGAESIDVAEDFAFGSNELFRIGHIMHSPEYVHFGHMGHEHGEVNTIHFTPPLIRVHPRGTPIYKVPQADEVVPEVVRLPVAAENASQEEAWDVDVTKSLSESDAESMEAVRVAEAAKKVSQEAATGRWKKVKGQATVVGVTKSLAESAAESREAGRLAEAAKKASQQAAMGRWKKVKGQATAVGVTKRLAESAAKNRAQKHWGTATRGVATAIGVTGTLAERVAESPKSQQRDVAIVPDMPMFAMPEEVAKKELTIIETSFIKELFGDGPVPVDVPVDRLAAATQDNCHDEIHIQNCQKNRNKWDPPRTKKACIDMCCLELTNLVGYMVKFQKEGEGKEYALTRYPQLIMQCVRGTSRI